MDEIAKKLGALIRKVEVGLAAIGADELREQITALQADMSRPDFWQDVLSAQKIVQRESKLRLQLEPWESLLAETKDLHELAVSGDVSLAAEISERLAHLTHRYSELRRDLLFSGTYDNHDAILRLSAGAGGD